MRETKHRGRLLSYAETFYIIAPPVIPDTRATWKAEYLLSLWCVEGAEDAQKKYGHL